MANIERDLSVSPHLSQKEGPDLSEGISDPSWDSSSPLKETHDTSTRESADDPVRGSPPIPTDAKSTSNPSRPSLVQLGANSGSSTGHPKRFSAVNINKKFLEKNSSTVGPPPTSQSSVTAKSGGSVLVRPQAQPPSSHSRLVTTKLTSTSPASSTGGAGWSRPSSAAPPATAGSHSPNGGSPLLPTASMAVTTVAPGTTPLPHAKLIQPQPRTALPQGPSGKSVSGVASTKPVWKSLKSSQGAVQRPEVRQNDFPTAAEVAQGTTSLRLAKANDAAEAAVIAAANKQARIEEADTFRGVHLDPNAHHWDEMEEDDDNFLGGVIEFGDGRQYKVEPSSRPSDSPPLPESVSLPHGAHIARSRSDEVAFLKDPSSEVPVSKEERFADDFDRSWPRSRTSPALSTRDFPPSSGQLSASTRTGPAIPISPVTSHSPQETSRVLFNERSNKLEPYSHTRTGQSKRGSYHESSISPTGLKSPRDIPPASPLHSNIQLLQKHGNTDHPSRSRRFSSSSSGAIASGYSGSYQRDRDQLQRDEPPHSPHISKNSRDVSELRDDHGERGRRSVMGPPPLPPHALRRPSKDGGRQLPPHLPEISQSTVPSQGRLSSRDSKFTAAGGSAASQPPSQSPALSHASAALISPIVATSSLPQLSAPELDEVRKDVMQSAAARAKQRRQQEEEEREKEKERARRKAAEIEQRMKAADAEKAKSDEAEKPAEARDDEVIAIIEEAVQSVSLSKDTAPQSHRLQAGAKPSVPRSPPLEPVSIQTASSRSPTARRISTSASSVVAPSGSAMTPPVQGESWRSKTAPSHLPLERSPKASVPSFLPPPPSALEQVESLASNLEEELEIVDFSDMGKFVGATDVPASPLEKAKKTLSPQSSRPVASDFFGDTQESLNPTSTNIVNWRQRLSDVIPEQDGDMNVHLVRDKQPDPAANPRTSEQISPSIDHVQPVTGASQVATQRTLRAQPFYKEATMSALDDVMSRIKGALDGMQTGEAAKEVPPVSQESDSSTTKSSVPRSLGRPSSQKDRWIPPPLRLQSYDHEALEEPVTVLEPPRSPKPAWNAFVVRLPISTRAVEPISRRQLHLFSKPVYHIRWDILSFDPPVEGMNRRDFALNDVLFGKPPRPFKGNPKYRVVLPRLGPRVNIPSYSHSQTQKSSGVGAFGRPGGADEVATWRKPASAKLSLGDPITSEHGLDTTSRSPPPDTLSTDSNITSLPNTNSSDPVKADGLAAPMRSRLQPKMPAGSAVAFYRDSRIDAVEADLKPSVNFIVTSELEESRDSAPVKIKPSITVTSPSTYPSNDPDSVLTVKPLVNGIASSPLVEHSAPSLNPSKAESKSSEDSTDHVPITPPSQQNSPWTRTSLSISLKESPARGPDPEHLKAVWSQTSNKSGLHSINSLEGIADDLTALPFTLHEVKSEDGETPPPSVSAVPSRMSLHDVTKAFQQVPSSSSSSSTSHRTPPATAPPNTRPANYAYTLPPPPPNNMRPSYGAYPSPMLSHSPGPGVMYPHPITSSPVPSRMPVNGHTTVYSPPMWMSMAGPPSQNHGNMMRPMNSPYPAQLMPYPSPGTPAMYASQSPGAMQNTSQQQTGGQASRDRNMSLMSPVMPHAAPAMYGSPVLMHAPVMPVSQNHGYMPGQGSGRGQVRADSGHLPMQHPQQSNFLSSPSAYSSVASPSFARSPW